MITRWLPLQVSFVYCLHVSFSVLSFDLFVSSYLKCVSYTQHIVVVFLFVFCFFFFSLCYNLCHWFDVFSPFMMNSLIDVVGFRSIILLFVYSLSYMFYFPLFLLSFKEIQGKKRTPSFICTYIFTTSVLQSCRSKFSSRDVAFKYEELLRAFLVALDC